MGCGVPVLTEVAGELEGFWDLSAGQVSEVGSGGRARELQVWLRRGDAKTQTQSFVGKMACLILVYYKSTYDESPPVKDLS